MRVSSTSLACAWGLLVGAAQAQFLVTELSFGFGNRISPDHNGKTVPYFELQGSPYQPEVLSNKVILTPGAPAPGNQRGAVWSERTLEFRHWITDVDFRVSGPERGGGNLNIWIVKDGPSAVGMSSIYTVGKFEGLALVLDTSRTRMGGTLRGYLNDGTKEYKALTGIDSLAFAQCEYSYRNLGRPSQIKIQQTDGLFSVAIDGNPCFSSQDIAIPPGYRVGVTAASADVPDSAELFKLVVMHSNSNSNSGSGSGQQQAPVAGGEGSAPVRIGRSDTSEDAPPDVRTYEKDNILDADANSITSSEAQFADLHNRLQSINHHLSTIFRRIASSDQMGEKRHEELSIQLDRLNGVLSKLERLDMIENRMEKMERDVRSLNNELRSAVTAAEKSVKYHVAGHLDGHHDRLAEKLKHPGHMRLILVVVGGQILLAATYVVYKRRKASSPKKYL